MLKIDYTGKVVAVTGGGTNIGQSIAMCFAACGATVAVLGRTLETLEDTCGKIREAGGRAEPFITDVTKKESVAKTMADIEAKLGGLDVLVNNAGINGGPDDRKPIHEYRDELWTNLMNVDLNGVFVCSKAAVPYMIRRGGGAILNVSSVVGMVPFRLQCAFTAAKAGVINLSKAMALELAPHGIRVNVLSPGTTAMNLTASLWSKNSVMEALLNHIPMHRQGLCSEMAGTSVFLCSDLASYTTGTVVNVDGGWICGYNREL